ncbi:MAG: pilus assembly protein [Silicimonas sp.]|nr:pilus assembly protein [Silicimonas sp.]
MSGLVKKYKKFEENQDGSATIEFTLLFPAFMALFFMGFESGYFMVRNVMLERAVDVAVRDVRLANGAVPELDQIKTNICNVITITDDDCESNLQVEIRPVAPEPGGVAAAGNEIRCIDKRVDPTDDANATIYATGSGNQLMLVRVCSLAQPMFPTTGIGAGLKYDSFGNYALVATSAFVNEPADSTDREDVPFYVSGNNGFGNGDQDAPGDSLDYNNAENDQTPGTSGIGGGSNS